MKKTILSILNKTKLASDQIANLSEKTRKDILLEIAFQLRKNKKQIFFENKKDIKKARANNKTKAFIERLTLTEKGFDGIINQLKIVAGLKGVLGETIEQRILKNKINLKKIRFPLGVILMVYESRPNVTIDVAGLCIKSGNAVVLKGGKESIFTNRIFIECIKNSFKKFNLNNSAVSLLENISHEEMIEILSRKDIFDVVIPRGSTNLINAVANNSKIPILYHSAGGARAYIDKSADLKMAIDLIVNAKTQRNSVCNALDCVLIHKEVEKEIMPGLVDQLIKHKVQIRADKKTMAVIVRETKQSHSNKIAAGQVFDPRNDNINLASNSDFTTEFLDAVIAIKSVKDSNEAIEFIKRNSHHHTEMIIAKNKKVIKEFINKVDAASIMVNCSSRLNDGGEFEMGAEMGTSTGKLHARGPVGVCELTTYKWVAIGNGQIKT